MDKLQPIIKNRFWILAGLLLPLAMYGFFSANSKLKAATESRETALDGVLSGIPGGTNDANEKYEQGLKKINEAYTKNVDQSIVGIWNKQQERMTWPNVVRNHLPKKFLGDFDYRGVVAYQAAYPQLMKDLQARVEPVMPMEGSRGLGGGPMIGGGAQPKPADVPWQQKVILAASIPQAHFGRMRPTSEQIWNAQIDIWLLRLLFDSVARLNEDKDSATEAILRRIDTLQLVGGDGEPVLTGGSSGGGGDGSGGYGEAMTGPEPGAQGGGYGGGAQTGGTKVAPISFSPAQEFGSDLDSSGDGGGGGGGADDMAYGGPGSGGGGGAQNQTRLRYIAESEDAPFLERGFYMSVIIMQDKIPDFLVALADSEWPIRVVRYNVGKNPHYSEKRTTGGFLPGFGSGEEMTFGPAASDTFGGGSGYGGGDGALGGVGAKTGIPGVGNLIQNLPPFADAAMQNPNLVQLDLCGVITMYKQPQIIIDAIDNPSASSGGLDQQGGNPAASEELAPAATEEPVSGNSDPAAADATPEAAESTTDENVNSSELEKL